MVPPRSVGLSNPLASQSLVAQSCHCNGGGHDWHAWKRDPAIGLEAGVIAAMAGREDQARASFASVIEVAPDSVEAGRARTYLTRLDGGAQQEGPSGR